MHSSDAVHVDKMAETDKEIAAACSQCILNGSSNWNARIVILNGETRYYERPRRNFCRCGARPPTEMMVEFVDQHKGWYGIEPICEQIAPPLTLVQEPSVYEIYRKFFISK
ncbi:hypothetical protein SAMN05428978_11002 [Nitrosomonas sp. Nm34]|nr:hypothetical protein SAMN05428978_11002 [Nitrosomonas sp. Nm34]